MNANTMLFFDMDDTIARYNFATPNPLEDMYKPAFFLNLKPHVLAYEVNKLAAQYPENIYILSACITEICKEEKIAWVMKWLPNLLLENVILVNVGENKAEKVTSRLNVALNSNHVLIDDYSKNLYEWEMQGGTAVKCLNSFNNRRGLYYKYKFRTVKQFHKVLNDITANNNYITGN